MSPAVDMTWWEMIGKEKLIPSTLNSKQTSIVYANEADVLNMALFGNTAKQWRNDNPTEKGNIRDKANIQ